MAKNQNHITLHHSSKLNRNEVQIQGAGDQMPAQLIREAQAIHKKLELLIAQMRGMLLQENQDNRKPEPLLDPRTGKEFGR